MEEPTTDEVAQEAARVLELGKADSIERAIHIARERMSVHSHEIHPSHALVRKHAQALSMQTMGEEQYLSSQRHVWEVAEEIMTAMEEHHPVLAGRAARGHVDAGVTLHIRIYTQVKIENLAEELVELGYQEPGFETINTRWGRLNSILFEDDGVPVILTRCHPDMLPERGRNLFADEPVATIGLAELRIKLNMNDER